ncbi:hypothetical protein B0H10DRAFT_338834 [Mycena sp. CBHHK59/15]|nr:hypothetical protein B0H10DRAFT_338834 [Mycena sp. CBHHK59/15]
MGSGSPTRMISGSPTRMGSSSPTRLSPTRMGRDDGTPQSKAQPSTSPFASRSPFISKTPFSSTYHPPESPTERASPPPQDRFRNGWGRVYGCRGWAGRRKGREGAEGDGAGGEGSSKGGGGKSKGGGGEGKSGGGEGTRGGSEGEGAGREGRRTGEGKRKRNGPAAGNGPAPRDGGHVSPPPRGRRAARGRDGGAAAVPIHRSRHRLFRPFDLRWPVGTGHPRGVRPAAPPRALRSVGGCA